MLQKTLRKADPWLSRLRTLRAMGALTIARLTVRFLRFDRWSHTLGKRRLGNARIPEAQGIARQVEWAASRLPFELKCLPRAMALSWMLRAKGIGHLVVFAVRPAELRDSGDALHAWVEIDGTKVIGDLAGPWFETLRLGG
jgi:hypothetical protein